jgi:hypothetical protein
MQLENVPNQWTSLGLDARLCITQVAVDLLFVYSYNLDTFHFRNRGQIGSPGVQGLSGPNSVPEDLMEG